MKIVASFFAIIISIYLIFVFGLSKIILRSPSVNKTVKGLTELFLRPTDLYTPLFIKDLDISRKNESISTDFKIKYLGPYFVGLILKTSNNNVLFNKIPTDLKLSVSFFDNGKLLKTDAPQDQLSPFSSNYHGGESFYFLMFKCPEEIPLNKSITCEIKVLNPDKQLIDEYGPSSVFVARLPA
jgi:hypothetical protein